MASIQSTSISPRGLFCSPVSALHFILVFSRFGIELIELSIIEVCGDVV